MTREKMILDKLNTTEQRIKGALLEDDTQKVNEYMDYQRGYIASIRDLGYKVVIDGNKTEEVEGNWIYVYSEIVDIR
jgi:hypothetical protein